jgi:modulator of FtsH protease
MNDPVNGFVYPVGYGQVLTPTERQRVLRNTYWLLALSMVPTVLGAWLGVELQIGQMLRGILGMVVFLGGAFGFMVAIERTKHTSTGVTVLLGFTFFMGLMLSGLISHTLGFRNGPELIMTAFAGTAGVFFGMATLASVIKTSVEGLGKWLMAGLMVLIVGSIINLFVGSTGAMLVISMLAIAIFSLYILYDLKQIMEGGETNYISATLRIYLDVYNVFVNLLSLLGIFGGERE